MSAANTTVLCKGRFLVDAIPFPSPLSRYGYLYRWSVTDFDLDQEYSGLAASLTCASLEAMTAVKRAKEVSA